MFGSVVLDVAIGMAFVYLLLSLIASVVQEMLATFMQLRSANLLRGSHRMRSPCSSQISRRSNQSLLANVCSLAQKW